MMTKKQDKIKIPQRLLLNGHASISDLWFSNVAMKGKKKKKLGFFFLKVVKKPCVEVTVSNIEELKLTAWIITSKKHHVWLQNVPVS